MIFFSNHFLSILKSDPNSADIFKQGLRPACDFSLFHHCRIFSGLGSCLRQYSHLPDSIKRDLLNNSRQFTKCKYFIKVCCNICIWNKGFLFCSITFISSFLSYDFVISLHFKFRIFFSNLQFHFDYLILQKKKKKQLCFPLHSAIILLAYVVGISYR